VTQGVALCHVWKDCVYLWNKSNSKLYYFLFLSFFIACGFLVVYLEGGIVEEVFRWWYSSAKRM